jgi:hypothetical protein
VQPRLHPGGLRSVDNRPGVFRREHTCLAEDVAPFGQAFGGDRRNHVLDDQIDVALAASAVLDRHFMRAHERGRQLDRLRRVQIADHVQHLQFGFGGQPVAALRFGGGGAAAQHLGEPPAGVGRQYRLARVARGQHRAEDSAAFGGNLLIAGAGHPPPELRAPVAGEHDVRMRIDEAWHHGAAAGIDDRGVRRQRDFVGEQAFEADEDDPSVAGRDGGAGDRSSVALGSAAPGGRTGAGEKFRNVVDEEVSGNHVVMRGCRMCDGPSTAPHRTSFRPTSRHHPIFYPSFRAS